MATSIECLKWQSLTAAINEIKSPNSFIKNLLFGRHQTFPTESVEVGLLTGARDMAPFVRKDGEAILVGGLGESFRTVGFPSIRIKRPFTASELLFGRRPGTVIFPTKGQQLSAIEQHIARDLQHMADMIANAEEWLCAQALTGEISYTAADEAHFVVTMPKPTGHTLNVAATWGTAATATPGVDFLAAKRLMHEEHGLPVTDALLSKAAAANFIKIAEVKELLDNRRILIGDLDLRRQFEASGALYLGEIYGVRVWEYGRAVILPDGSSEDLIRANYAEFVCARPEADNQMYYGAIPDMKALQGRLFQGERFSKSWMQEDPSVLMQLVHSRPLPVMRRPGSVVSMHTLASL